MLSALLVLRRDWVQSLATTLEDQLGPEDAIRAIRSQIAVADRRGRVRLYKLHDEIARRHGWWLSETPAT